MPSKFLDLTSFVTVPLEFDVELNGEKKRLIVRDPTMMHVLVSEQMRQEAEEYEKKNKGAVNAKRTADLVFKKAHALLSLDNEITEDEVRQLGFLVCSKIHIAVSDAIEKAFLAESSLEEQNAPSQAKSPENSTASPDSASSSQES